MKKDSLIFVYNADSSLYALATDYVPHIINATVANQSDIEVDYFNINKIFL